jgi:hypothetical protein
MGIARLGVDNWREDVDDGSKGAEEGVSSAFKFCVIESSIVLRDMRRKSIWVLGLVSA